MKLHEEQKLKLEQLEDQMSWPPMETKPKPTSSYPDSKPGNPPAPSKLGESLLNLKSTHPLVGKNVDLLEKNTKKKRGGKWVAYEVIDFSINTDKFQLERKITKVVFWEDLNR